MASLSIITQMEYFLRIILAMVCGGVIGFEREHRVKSAGLKTHMIVSMGAAVMMVTSKYGFLDLLAVNVSYDASRVAASIVSAIGFLGAGVIFTKGFKVTGVTTAAGLWTTVGIGMMMGAGLYYIAGAVTILVLMIQMFFRHVHLRIRNAVTNILLTAEGTREELEELRDTLKRREGTVIHTKFSALPDDPERLEMELTVILSGDRDCERNVLDLFETIRATVTSVSFEAR